jgi:hypothetical protein
MVEEMTDYVLFFLVDMPSYWADDEKFYDDQGNMVVETFGCWVEGCVLSPADFTFDVVGMNRPGALSEEVAAFR